MDPLQNFEDLIDRPGLPGGNYAEQIEVGRCHRAPPFGGVLFFRGDAKVSCGREYRRLSHADGAAISDGVVTPVSLLVLEPDSAYMCGERNDPFNLQSGNLYTVEA